MFVCFVPQFDVGRFLLKFYDMSARKTAINILFCKSLCKLWILFVAFSGLAMKRFHLSKTNCEFCIRWSVMLIGVIITVSTRIIHV